MEKAYRHLDTFYTLESIPSTNTQVKLPARRAIYSGQRRMALIGQHRIRVALAPLGSSEQRAS